MYNTFDCLAYDVWNSLNKNQTKYGSFLKGNDNNYVTFAFLSYYSVHNGQFTVRIGSVYIIMACNEPNIKQTLNV